MVEHDAPWGRKVPKQAEHLDPAVRAKLLEHDALDHVRVELIKRPLFSTDPGPPDGGGPINVFVGRVDEQGGTLWHWRLDRATALTSLDLDVLEAGKGGARRVEEPVFFVCTHGTRDACCALHGMPVYRDLAALRPDHVWQCSHLGGHRFAPTLLVLPHGAVYGRVDAASTGALVKAAASGELHDLESLRGRSCYPRPAQAAEVMLRRATGALAVDALKLLTCEAADGERWRVCFSGPDGDHALELVRERLRVPVLGSCGDEAPEPAYALRLVDHARLG
jgi:hypothetical protein